MQPAEKLVMMANQIARNLAAQGEDDAVAATAEHIVKFWDPRMRSMMAQHVASGGDGLTPLALKAMRLVPAPAKAKAG
jgi:formate dehydrogenase subunit delta